MARITLQTVAALVFTLAAASADTSAGATSQALGSLVKRSPEGKVLLGRSKEVEGSTAGDDLKNVQPHVPEAGGSLVQRSAQGKILLGRKKQGDAELSAPPKKKTTTSSIYVIGDTHGDFNYLVRCLLATDRFRVEHGQLVWKAKQKTSEFEVVVLGDFIDRGTFSRSNALLLKRLTYDKDWGAHLVVLLGNHEEGTLMADVDLIGRSHRNENFGDWSIENRAADLRATNGERLRLMRWMRKRQVTHLAQGVLMMHGGLRKIIAEDAKTYSPGECRANGATCGEALTGFINREASKHYAQFHECIQRQDRTNSTQSDLSEQPKAPLCSSGPAFANGP